MKTSGIIAGLTLTAVLAACHRAPSSSQSQPGSIPSAASSAPSASSTPTKATALASTHPESVRTLSESSQRVEVRSFARNEQRPVSTTSPTSASTVFKTAQARVIGDGAHYVCVVPESGDAAVTCANLWYTDDEIEKTVSSHLERGFATPAAPALRERIRSLTVGATHACALVEMEVWCWGWNQYGQLGQGHLLGVDVAQRVAIDGPVTEVVAGAYHTCATTTEGRAICWGNNTEGQIDPTRSASEMRVPTEIKGLAGKVTHIGPGDSHTCAVVEESRIQCWGFHQGNRLGPDLVVDTPNIVDVPLPPDKKWTAVAAGNAFTCALDDAGAAWCWGALPPSDESLNKTREYVPARPSSPAPLDTSGQRISKLLISGASLCWLTEAGAHDCRGDGQPALTEHLAQQTPGAASGRCFLARGDETMKAGTIFCSRNAIDRLATVRRRAGPVPPQPRIPPGETQAQMTYDLMPSFLSCALSSEGAVECWGMDIDAYFGGTYNNTAVARLTFAGTGTTQLVGMRYQVCGRRADKSGWCMHYGQMMGQPYTVELFDDIENLATWSGDESGRDQIFCLLRPGGEIKCMGSERLATGPLKLPDGVSAERMAVGNDVVCVASAEHVAYCWGTGVTRGKELARENEGEAAILARTESLGDDIVAFGQVDGRICAKDSQALIRCTGTGFFGRVSWEPIG